MNEAGFFMGSGGRQFRLNRDFYKVRKIRKILPAKIRLLSKP